MFTTPKLVDPTLIFEFAIELRQWVEPTKPSRKKKPAVDQPSSVVPWMTDDKYALFNFASLRGGLSHSRLFAAWSVSGMIFQANVRGKKKLPRLVDKLGGFSDGLRIWIDTRCSPGIHRGTRYCHCFHFFPGKPNSGSTSVPDDRPFGLLDHVDRAREHPMAIENGKLEVHCSFTPEGYDLWARIPADCLTGYSPLEFDRISFLCDVVDHELGTQSLSIGPPYRYSEDPSLWVQAALRP